MSTSFGRTSRLKLMWPDPRRGRSKTVFDLIVGGFRAGDLKTVFFDVVSNESFEALTAITSHPVEEGSDVADHARVEPISIPIEGFLSFTPLYQNPGVADLAGYSNKPLSPLYPPKLGGAPIFTPGGLTSAVAGAVGDLLSPPTPPQINSLAFTSPDAARKRVLDIIADLKDAQKFAARISVLAGGGAHDLDDMLIRRLSIPRTPEDAGGMVIQLELQQVRIVTSELVAAPVSADARGQPNVTNGSKAAAPLDPAKAEKMKSTALQIAQGLYNGGKGTFLGD